MERTISIDRYQDKYESEINLPEGIENLGWDELVDTVIDPISRDCVCVVKVDAQRLALMLKQTRNNYIASQDKNSTSMGVTYKSYVDVRTWLLYTCSDEEAEEIVAKSKCDPKRVKFGTFVPLKRARRTAE